VEDQGKSPLKRRFDIADALHDWFVGGHFQREVSCFVAEGIGVVAMSTQDRAGHVEFDFLSIWETLKTAPVMPKIVWMLHTHPTGCYGMSGEDANSIKGWVTGLGMPIEMVVVSDGGSRHYRCTKGGVIVDHGFIDSDLAESFVVSLMSGISCAGSPYTSEEFDIIVKGVNRVIPPTTWKYFEHIRDDEPNRCAKKECDGNCDHCYDPAHLNGSDNFESFEM
jgi:hypothetical protein